MHAFLPCADDLQSSPGVSKKHQWAKMTILFIKHSIMARIHLNFPILTRSCENQYVYLNIYDQSKCSKWKIGKTILSLFGETKNWWEREASQSILLHDLLNQADAQQTYQLLILCVRLNYTQQCIPFCVHDLDWRPPIPSLAVKDGESVECYTMKVDLKVRIL